MDHERIGESAVQFECKLIHSHEMKNKHGEATATLLVGEAPHVCHCLGRLSEMDRIIPDGRDSQGETGGGREWQRTTGVVGN